jgi:uncharacterized PurR-regulated membrane protein YhhQ (DUF165 family)
MRTPVKPVAPDAKATMENYQKDKAAKYGLNYIEPTQPKWFVSYPYMIALMATFQIMSIMYGRKFVMYFGFNGSHGGVMLLPVVLYIFQIVAECYGWQYARQVVWCNFIVNLTTTCICLISNLFPFSSFNHADLQSSYATLMNTMWVSALNNCIVVYFSDFISSALMCWSRFQFNGRFVLIRIIILHIVSEMILLTGSFVVLSYNGYNIQQIIPMIYSGFIARAIVSIIMLPFARFAIWFIQHKIEGVVVFDYKTDFSPFKFNINPADSVQFNANGWDKINVGKIDVKKLAEAHSNGILDEQYQKLVDSIDKRSKS